MPRVAWFIQCAIHLIYPNVCGICDYIHPESLCKKCEIYLNKIAKITIDNYTNKNFRKHLYLFRYEEKIKERLLAYKFYQKSYIYHAFVIFMIKNKKICQFLKSYDIIIPVPIHYERKLVRGYNQSALLAKGLVKMMGGTMQYTDRILCKIKNNKPQSTQNKEERKRNVLGAYYVKKEENIIGKKILIVDDIYTTGSTVEECARVLKKAGAKWVDVLTIAKD